RYLDETPSSSPSRYRNDREERMTFEEPPAYQQRPVFEEPAAYEPRRTFEDQQPQRPRPASRRPVQSPGDPLDVEPLDFSVRDQAGRNRDAEVEGPPPRRNGTELDDPW
ncbi:MAG: photosystem reaction center subunit H, partial [Cyanobacteriota bacterium]|nr:photosystem reaction center subunit H [Cyanobacteriota bacterium]